MNTPLEMPATTDFKFTCPGCGQHMVVDPTWIGSELECPACGERFAVPMPPPEADTGLPSTTAAQPGAFPGPTPIPDRPVKDLTATNGATPPQLDASKAASPGTTAAAILSERQKPHIAVLTPVIKLEIVRSVRQRLADASAWLPWKMGERTAYAAKIEEGNLILVDVKNPEATRFSLIGAFLLEFHVRQVVPMAAGRGDFLDRELPEAVRKVPLEPMTTAVHEQAEPMPAEQNLGQLNHAQCLEVLALLEESYSQRINETRGEEARRRLGNVRLPDLVGKLEKKARIEPAEVATALFHEIAELNERLERLEGQSHRNTGS